MVLIKYIILRSRITNRCVCTGFSPLKEESGEKTAKNKDFRKTPLVLEKLEQLKGQHPHAEKEPLPEWKDGVNPLTGEIGGPRGVEPTRYGDWERKGRVTDF